MEIRLSFPSTWHRVQKGSVLIQAFPFKAGPFLHLLLSITGSRPGLGDPSCSVEIFISFLKNKTAELGFSESQNKKTLVFRHKKASKQHLLTFSSCPV